MIATRIPPRIYKAVTEKSVGPTWVDQDQRGDGIGEKRHLRVGPTTIGRAWPEPPPRPKPKRQPIDQRVLSYPLWWARMAFLKLSWLLDFPSRWAYKAAAGINWVGMNYGKIRSFGIAHAAGWVLPRTRDVRAKSCVGCRYHYTRDEQSFCKGDNKGRGCGCGHWRLARLGNKRSLSGWRCPDGKFDYGWLGRMQRRAIGFVLRSASDG